MSEQFLVPSLGWTFFESRRVAQVWRSSWKRMSREVCTPQEGFEGTAPEVVTAQRRPDHRAEHQVIVVPAVAYGLLLRRLAQSSCVVRL